MLKLYQCDTESDFFQLTKERFAGMMESEDYMPLATRMNSRHGDANEGYAFLSFRCYTRRGVYLHIEGTFQKGNLPGVGKVWMLNLVNKEHSMAVSDLDPVTGLLNMHAFYQRVEKKADELRAKAQPGDLEMRYCPVYLNLTNFKVYNELHGIYEGDRMLRRIGQMLKSKFPLSYITRLSGDNFALFVPRAGLEIKIRDLCHAVNDEIHIPNIMMKAGIGSLKVEPGERRRTITAYFDQAKLACDSIKKDATRFAAFYHDSMRQSVTDRIFILDNLDKAIEKGHIQVYFQPVIRTMTGKLCGCEALSRWIDPVKGTLPPDSFIPVLEESRLISRLDRYVIEKVAQLLRYQLENNLPMVPISVNLSRYDFILMDPLAFVEHIVEQYHIPRYYLRIEVTESVLVKNRHLLIDKLQQFHQSGYQVWLDDFGSAYSSLNVLQNYEFDELKIDQGLLRYFNEDSRKIIRSIVLMTKEMGIHVLAEGAETKEHVDFLRSIGCEKIQGYYYGRPMPYELLREHCKKKGWLLETLSEEQACDAAGLVNLITDAPVAIFQYREDDAQIISANDAYQKVLATSGTSSREEFNENMRTASYPPHAREIHDAARQRCPQRPRRAHDLCREWPVPAPERPEDCRYAGFHAHARTPRQHHLRPGPHGLPPVRDRLPQPHARLRRHLLHRPPAESALRHREHDVPLAGRRRRRRPQEDGRHLCPPLHPPRRPRPLPPLPGSGRHLPAGRAVGPL